MWSPSSLPDKVRVLQTICEQRQKQGKWMNISFTFFFLDKKGNQIKIGDGNGPSSVSTL